MSADDRLSPAQVIAVTALVTHGSTSQAAVAAGVTERTIRRWLATETFRVHHRARAQEVATEAMSDLLAAQREAVQTLRVGMRTGSPATQVRAARAVLEVAQRITAEDVDRRLTELEERAQTWHDRSRGWPGLSA